MKILPFVSMVTLVGWMAPVPCLATVVGTSTLEQPVNLGPKSDPARIPLGRVAVVSNHGYGVQLKIGEARPCPDGAMRWEGGSELDQNLASVFGISVESEDSTQISAFPVILRVKSWKPPGYSPYTKDQVLAATLWCLIRSTGGTPEHPLDIRVVTEGPDDKLLEAKYSGKYVTRPGEDKKEVPPVKVTGAVLEEDARGIAWVTFPDVARKATSVPPTAGMIILESNDDGDAGWHVLPVWGNGNDESDFLRLNSWSAAMCYSSYRPRGVTNANSFLFEGGANDFTVSREDKSDSVYFSHPRVKQATMAANILALVISAQPTEARPLSVSFVLEDSGLAAYSAFRDAPGWKETRQDSLHSHSVMLECEFVWDPATNKLTRGSIPLVQLGSRGWITLLPEKEAPGGDDGEKVAGLVQSQISQGIHDGSLLAEKVMRPDQLHGSGLPREIGKAGYYEALATYSNGEALPDESPDDPVKLNDSQLFQAHYAGWSMGVGRAQAIAIEARKTIEEAKLKKEK
jgi:hypothetical protein